MMILIIIKLFFFLIIFLLENRIRLFNCYGETQLGFKGP